MTPERIVELAKQAEVYGQTATRLGLTRFAELVAKEVREEERERCATICDATAKEFAVYRDHFMQRDGAKACAEAIRGEAK